MRLWRILCSVPTWVTRILSLPYNMWLLWSSIPSPSMCFLCCSIHPRDKQTVAYRLHLGARALAYGEKNLAFQGPLPKKIELLAHSRLLSLTYDQKIQVHRQDNKSFEVRIVGVEVWGKWGSWESYPTETLFHQCSVMMKQLLVGWGWAYLRGTNVQLLTH